MKTSLLFISFILFAFSTAPLSLADASPAPVRDTTGDELRTGVDYYILPVLSGRFGGLTLKSTRNETCPLDVVQSNRAFANGLPLTFTPVDPKKGVIRESTDLNIKFSAATICVQSTVWKLQNYDGQFIVTTNGVEGNPGPRTLSNWFKIETYDGFYKLVFCPTVCNTCKPVCGDLGITSEYPGLRLGLSDNPLWVRFAKA